MAEEIEDAAVDIEPSLDNSFLMNMTAGEFKADDIVKVIFGSIVKC
jgi:hypothetical protein